LIFTDPAFIELKRRCMEIIIKESMQLR